MRLAGAPISWGVCEVPGWGLQLAPDRVLTEMRLAGLAACEFGPPGFLPADPLRRAEVLRRHGLTPVGGFLPVVLHGLDPMPDVEFELDVLVASGAGVLVLAAATGTTGYDERPELASHQWATLLYNLDRAVAAGAARGVLVVLHPHVGTVVERAADVRRVLDGSAVPLCLDTGHLLIGGTDPVALAAAHPDRIAHVHLKDVDPALAASVRDGELTYTAGVRRGLYRPLGLGMLDVRSLVKSLRDSGYGGWFVLEQDTVLDVEPPVGDGPLSDVSTSVALLRGLAP